SDATLDEEMKKVSLIEGNKENKKVRSDNEEKYTKRKELLKSPDKGSKKMKKESKEIYSEEYGDPVERLLTLVGINQCMQERKRRCNPLGFNAPKLNDMNMVYESQPDDVYLPTREKREAIKRNNNEGSNVQLNDAITYVPPRKKLPKPPDESSRVRKEQKKREKGVLEKVKADERNGYITDALLDKSNLFTLSQHAALNISISEDIITSIEESTTMTSIKKSQPDDANNTYLPPKLHDEDTDQRATKDIDDSKRAEEKKGCITNELVIKP
ncbi:6234_t:CDS:2, partial [Acaulospora morrowiae]